MEVQAKAEKILNLNQNKKGDNIKTTMESRLEEGEDINSVGYSSTDVVDDSSVPLLPENEEIQSGREMGQHDQPNYQSQL